MAIAEDIIWVEEGGKYLWSGADCGRMGPRTGDGSRTTGFQRSPASPLQEQRSGGHVIQWVVLCSCKTMLSR
jgi:hypothetical protein